MKKIPKMKLPDEIFGQPVEGALQKYLEKSQKTKAQTSQDITKTTSIEGINLADYLILPQHNLYVAKQTSYNGKNWYEAHESLHRDRARMLTIREFVDFLKLLKSGYAQDGLEQRLPENEIFDIYNSITEKRDPWRGEWLDAYFFKDASGATKINYEHRDVNGRLQPQKSEPLENCIMEDAYVNLFSANRQGLPTRKSKVQEEIFYQHPKDGTVAGFGASSDAAYLVCDRNPADDLWFGVRAVREKKIV